MEDSKKLDLILEKLGVLENGITDVKLHLENFTDKNVQLLAENHIELVKKLNQAISVTDKNLLYEVKMNYLTEKIDNLEKKIKELESKIA